MNENIEFLKNQASLARTEIKNLRSTLSALKHEHLKEIRHIKTVLNELKCSSCTAVATTIISNCNDQGNETQTNASNTDTILYRPIGYIESSFANKRAVPRQPSVLSGAKGAVVIDFKIFNNPEHALSGLEEFSHMWIIFHFHKTESINLPAKVAPPRLGGEKRGVFSTRTPHRPCPIGLSLVKIHSIEGNKVIFNGLDMINGTPVLDIKPFIPQYDYPMSAFGEHPLSSLDRPPTEGISDAVSNLQVGNNIGSQGQHLSTPIGIDTENLSDSPFEDDALSMGNDDLMPSPESPSSVELPDGPNTFPIQQVESERGDPDGQERFTPPQLGYNINSNPESIHIASWISNPPSQRFLVTFTDDALERLNGLIGERAQTFKSNIESLLSEDPRSHYVKTRYPDHEYSCVLEDLCISCVFNSNSSVCTIVAIRSAEDLQN